MKTKMMKTMKTMKVSLWTIVVLMALVGTWSVVMYIVNHNVQITKTSMLPREIIQDTGVARIASLTQGEADSLAMLEDTSLLGLTAGAFNPQFAPLSSSEQATLKTSESQRPELQKMTAGDLDDNAGLGSATWGGVLIVALLLILIF